MEPDHVELARFRWDPETGIATLSHADKAGRITESERMQPTLPTHVGWNAKHVLASRSRSEMIFDSLFGYAANAFY